MTEAEFDRYIASEDSTNPIKYELNLTRAVHTVEHQFHVCIDYNYPYFKLLSQIEYLNWKNAEEKKQYNKSKHKNGR